MKYLIILLTIYTGTTLMAQTKDRRAELKIEGRVNEISMSPDEKIWLATAMGYTYYTQNIDSNWHYGSPIFQPTDEFGFDNPHLERVSFFNKDTAILTGYISVSKKDSKKNGLFFTKNGGNTWKTIDFGGDSWIYNVYTDKNGTAWMGGSSGDIFYSKDFGQHWDKLNTPYNSFSRMHCIFMNDSKVGVTGALNNAIYSTNDNWKTNKKIITPYDQKKYTNESGYSDDRIEKILIWNNFIVVNQNGHIFYTDEKNIDWQPFPVNIVEFELDKDSKKLFAVTNQLKVITFSSPTEFKTLFEKQLLGFPIDMKVVNHSLYIVANGYQVYRANETGLTQSIPYTTDKKISEPNIIKNSSHLIWGINYNQIYLAENNQLDWYRENALNFDVSDFILKNDSVAILWDGVKNNYVYSLSKHEARIYYPEKPINSFLLSPIKSISIHSGSRGCFHSAGTKVVYESTDDSTLETRNSTSNKYQDEETSKFKNKVNSKQLSSVLSTINLNHTAIPTLKEFQITEEDKKNYLSLVEKQLNENETNYSSRNNKIKKEFYYLVPAMLDTLNDSIITEILNQRENVWSTTSNWFNVQIINQNNDTINIIRNYYVRTLPWNLPWKFEYKGSHFNSYNIEFSRFINSCIPKDFMDKDVFDNSLLIMRIAEHLYYKQK